MIFSELSGTVAPISIYYKKLCAYYAQNIMPDTVYVFFYPYKYSMRQIPLLFSSYLRGRQQIKYLAQVTAGELRLKCHSPLSYL